MVQSTSLGKIYRFTVLRLLLKFTLLVLLSSGFSHYSEAQETKETKETKEVKEAEETKAAEECTFPSENGVTVTADLYLASEDKNTPMILLFHQARSSRGEYAEIAPKLVKAGFNCLAVDQRSGETQKGVENLTVKSAQAAGAETTFPDAIPDMLAAAKFVRSDYSTGPIIAWGSSYSASLALHVAGEYPGGFAGVVAFSPGEYFASFGKSSQWIERSARKIRIPVFMTSAKGEEKQSKLILNAIPQNVYKRYYLPETDGNHGSKALWEEYSDHQGYWDAVMAFLKNWLPEE